LSEVDRTKVEALVLPGGDFWPTFENHAFTNFVCDLAASRVPIGGICAATTYLARIGLLDRVAHTSNDLKYLKHVVPEYKGEHLYNEKLAVGAGDVITVSGLGAVEFTYEFLKRLKVYSAPDCERWFKAFKHGDLDSQLS
jgi:putative intracellular protease/amidase